ncbi:MAG: pyrroline-5-carboxylate reductase [Proteobacteria bacterium]|nr:pyrroline-5-carboxylate reductase [Pseudomonadota bacterium]
MTTIGFLGGGNIAQAIIGGLIDNGTSPADIHCHDPAAGSQQKLASLGIQLCDSNDAVVQAADVVMLCVKPNVLPDLLGELTADCKHRLFVSVAAGVLIRTMSERLGPDTAIVRCMPNTPALVGTGMTALFASPAVSPAQRDIAEGILSAVGKALWVQDEAQLDAVTAVSGSGPAYFFRLMELMISAAINEGLDEATARELVLQTALGAARMASASQLSPGELREQVTSPGGTTQAALAEFDAADLEGIVTRAVQAARQRSVELSGH